MTKLKILEDLRATKWKNNHTKEVEDWVKIDELKAEAIKWIKFWITNEKNHASKKEDIYAQGKLDAFADFFNLTKKDLK